jgi:hypothetical protein
LGLTSIDLDKYDVDESAFNLKDLMEGVLERVVTIYNSYGVPLPERKYWTMTQPAIDCEQLVVYFGQAYLGMPGDQAAEPQRCNVPRSAVINIMLARPVPVVGQSGQTPGADKIQKASEIVAVDSWILMQSLNLLDQWDDDGLYGPGVIATVTSGETSGGFQSVVMQVTMVIP